MSTAVNTNVTYFSNYANAPDGVVRTDAPVKAHPLVVAASGKAGDALSGIAAVGGTAKNADGLGTRSDTKR